MWFEHSQRIIARFEDWEKQSEKNYDAKSKDALFRLANFIYWIENVMEGQEYVKQAAILSDPDYMEKAMAKVNRDLGIKG